MHFDSVLGIVGEFGRFQKCIVVLKTYMILPVAWLLMGEVFLAAVPKHQCSIHGVEHLNISQDVLLKLTLPMEEMDGSLTRSQCRRYDMDYGNMTTESAYQKLREMQIKNVTLPPTVGCDSWDYDRSQYKTSIVTEVSTISPCITNAIVIAIIKIRSSNSSINIIISSSSRSSSSSSSSIQMLM